MAMPQKDRHAKIAQKAFEMVQYFPKNEYPSRFTQNSYEYVGSKAYTVKESTGATCHRVVHHQYSNDSTINGPVVSHPKEHIQYFGGVRPFVGHANPFDGPKERPITCDEALKRYGGVLIKEYRR